MLFFSKSFRLLALASAVSAQSMLDPEGPDCSGDNVFCNDGFGECYCYDPNFTTHYEAAVSGCLAAGYEVVSIMSEEENLFIHSKITNGLEWDHGQPYPESLNDYAVWIGLLDRHGTSKHYSWVTGEDAVYFTKGFLDREGEGSDCFTMKRARKWTDEPTGNWVDNGCTGGVTSVVCQRYQDNALELQEAFLAVVPSGIANIFVHRDSSYLTASIPDKNEYPNDEIVALRGQPGQSARFTFIPHISGVGFLIKAASSSEDTGFIGLRYNAESGAMESRPTLETHSKAAIFVLESQDSDSFQAPYGLRLKYSPDVFLSANLLGEVTYTKSEEQSLRYTLDVQGAPEKYTMVLSMDDFDFEKALTDNGTIESAVAVERTVAAPEEGTQLTIELATEEQESRTLTTSSTQLKEDFVKGSFKTSYSQEISAEAGGSFMGFSAKATTTTSVGFEATVEGGTTWQKSNTVTNDVSESRTVRFLDSLQVDVPAGTQLRASLIVTRQKAQGITTTVNARLYADGTLVATSSFPVTIDAVAASTGTIKVEKLNNNRRALRVGSNHLTAEESLIVHQQPATKDGASK